MEDRVRASFAAQGLMATLGAKLARIDEGRVVITAEARPDLSEQRGAVHGGAIFALADTAAGYAALSVMMPDREVATAEMKINFLAPATGRLTATGQVRKAGRRLVIVSAEVHSDDALVAVAQGTMVPLARKA